jgi:outer membrane immunogenic protein
VHLEHPPIAVSQDLVQLPIGVACAPQERRRRRIFIRPWLPVTSPRSRISGLSKPKVEVQMAQLNLNLRLVATVLVVACCMPAFADGVARRSPGSLSSPECCIHREFSWTGIFVGGHLGGAVADVDWRTSPTEGFDHNQTSFGGGVLAAAQYQWGKMVAGVEVSYTWVDLNDSSTALVTPGLTFSSSINDLLIVAAKLGYAQDRALFFTKAGYASAEFTIQSTAAGVTSSSTEREDGWMIGLGLDYALSDRIVVGVAYDWLFFNTGTRTVGGLTGDADNNDVQQLMARLIFKFGRN